METVYKYAMANNGLQTDETYEYAGMESEACFADSSLNQEPVLGYRFVTGTEEYIRRALAAIGPLAVAMNAELETFFGYSTGIYDDPTCGREMTHAVCLVGRLKFVN
jgi:hypothetical protein